MSILHVVQFSLPEVCSGYTLRTQAIVREQQALGLEPVVLTSPRHPTDQPCDVRGVRHFRCPPERTAATVWTRDVRRVRALARRIAEVAQAVGSVKVIHAHSPVLCGLAALRAARQLRLPVVYEVRGLWEEAMVQEVPRRRFGARYLLARFSESHVCRRANAVIAISEGLRSDLGGRGAPPDRITVVPNGVDTEAFAPRPESPGWRVRHGLLEGPLVLYLGAIRRYEGVEVLLDAFRLIRTRSPGAQLAVVGGGEDSGRVASLAAERGAGVAVLGSVPHDSVGEFYAAADIVAYPRLSTRATELVTPLKPLEAMAMAKAIVASDVGGLREMLTDGETACLVPPGSVAALADGLADLLDDESQRLRLGQTARSVTCERLDWRMVVKRYTDVYASLCAG